MSGNSRAKFKQELWESIARISYEKPIHLETVLIKLS